MALKTQSCRGTNQPSAPMSCPWAAAVAVEQAVVAAAEAEATVQALT